MSNDILLTNIPTDLIHRLDEFVRSAPEGPNIADFPEYAEKQFVVNMGYVTAYSYGKKYFKTYLDDIFKNTVFYDKIREIYIIHILGHDPGGLHTLHIDDGRNVGINLPIVNPENSRFIIQENNGEILEVDTATPHLFKANVPHGWINPQQEERSLISFVFDHEYDNWEFVKDLVKDYF